MKLTKINAYKSRTLQRFTRKGAGLLFTFCIYLRLNYKFESDGTTSLLCIQPISTACLFRHNTSAKALLVG